MEQENTITKNERRGLALSSLIISLVALFCAFVPGWRIFSMVIAIAAVIVALFVMTRVNRPGHSRTMSLLAIISALATLIAAAYFLLKTPAEEAASTPAELQDSTVSAPDEETMERLRLSMDSTQQQ